MLSTKLGSMACFLEPLPTLVDLMDGGPSALVKSTTTVGAFRSAFATILLFDFFDFTDSTVETGEVDFLLGPFFFGWIFFASGFFVSLITSVSLVLSISGTN